MQEALLTTRNCFWGRMDPDGCGKVREIYRVSGADGSPQLVITATDRISAFDVVLPNGISHKGKVLNGLSAFWLEKLLPICPNHFLTADVKSYPRPFQAYPSILTGRSMLVQRLTILPLECVIRGYLAGSGWKEYRENGTICGITLPDGLVEASRLPEPIFTPSTKAEVGVHDENIDARSAVDHLAQHLGVGLEAATARYRQMVEKSLQLYRVASLYALERGIIIADTKFEFGLNQKGELCLADEVLTPDSSRFWDAATYQPGRAQDSFDKQFVRDYLETLVWNKQPPAPELPEEVIARTREKYLAAYQRITGKMIQ